MENFRNASIEAILNSLGIQPEKRNEREGWYKAFDRGERTASLKVDYTKNVFFDHGSGRGGGIVELLCLIKNCSLQEAVDFLKGSSVLQFSPPVQQKEINRLPEKNVIVGVKQIEHPLLIEYLQKRCIDLHIARKYCMEIEYKLNGKKYFSIGFPNMQGGFELRNAISKTCSSPKAPTWIKNRKPWLAVFEGFFDFLSALTIDPEMKDNVDILVLNSLSFHQKIRKEALTPYRRVFFFLDNDEAGNSAAISMAQLHHYTYDQSVIYSDQKDLNEWLVEFNIKGIHLIPRQRNNDLNR